MLPLVWTFMLDDVVAGLTLNVALAPAGNPDALSWTLPVNPLLGEIAIEYALDVFPAYTESDVGVADKLKSGAVAAAG